MAIQSVRRVLKKKNRKTHSKNKHRNPIGLWTKGVEVGFLVSSLLWAVEVSAKEANHIESHKVWVPNQKALLEHTEVSLPGPSRAPASTQITNETTNDSAAELKTEKLKASKNVSGRRLKYRMPPSVYRTEVLSPSFKQNPFYSPATFEVVRFRTF